MIETTDRDPGRAGATASAPVDVVGRHKRLVLRTAMISTLTLTSRLIGFARESLSASMFGHESPVNDAFVTAWRVPNLFRSMLGEGAISTSLQTAITRADAEQGEEAGRRLFLAISRVVGWLLLGLCGTMMLAVWLMPDAMPISGFAWLGRHPELVRELTLRMMPFVVLVCLSAVCSGALSVRGHFLSPNLAPVLMNVWWIAALFIVAHEFGWSRLPGTDDAAEYARQVGMARWLAGMVLVAGGILLLAQVPALLAKNLLVVPRRAASGRPAAVPAREILAVLKTSAPLALGAAVYQVNVMVDGLMAVALLEKDGGASLLYYATRVQQFPMSLVSIAATSAVFPALTALGHRRALQDLRTLHDRTHYAIAFVAIPASAGLLAFAEPVIAVCFQHGAFGAEGVSRAAAGLRCLTLAILPAGAAGLVARTYYAMGDFRTPVRISIAMLLANVVLNFTFVAIFGMDIDGLAFATALTAWGNLLLLLPGLRKRLGLPPAEQGFVARILRMGAAAVPSVLAARFVHAVAAPAAHPATALLGCIALAIGLYAALSHVLEVPEWRHVLDRVRRLGR